MQQRSGKHYLEAKREYLDSGRLGKVTLARTWWHGNGYHLRKAPASLQTKPDESRLGAFLGRLKWRDWDPQQYWNWRAYLDFGGGQVTDLFTHWIDVVHMFMGQDNPVAASAIGGVYNYKDGRTAPDTINVLLEYPTEFTATFEATLAPGITGAAVEFAGTKGRLLIDRGHYEFHSAEKGAPPVTVQAEGNLDQRPYAELPRLRAIAKEPERRCADRASLRAGFASGQHLLHAEAAHRFRPGAGRDSAVLAILVI